MAGLSKKDVEILNLKAARMSTASIAKMAGWSEARVYNRLGELKVTTVADALALLKGGSVFSLAGWARIDSDALRTLLSFAGQVEQTSKAVAVEAAAPAPPAPAVVSVPVAEAAPRPAPPRSATPRPRKVAAVAKPMPSTVAFASPPKAAVVPRSQPKPPSSPRGGLRLKSVNPRIATWASHFLRARWPLEEVAHLFDVAEDDLVLALGEAA